ncbi:MAG: hypothetical protein RRY54_04365 [Angelakisella sp.]
MQGQLIEGEAIPLTSPQSRQTVINGARYCCNEILCVITADTFKVAQRADSGAHLDTATGELTISCPNPACVKPPFKENVKGKTDLTTGKKV